MTCDYSFLGTCFLQTVTNCFNSSLLSIVITHLFSIVTAIKGLQLRAATVGVRYSWYLIINYKLLSTV